jgi:uncharacterized protein
MRKAKLWVLAASALTLALLGGVLFVALTGFAVLPAHAQSATATPTASGGIRTVLTATTAPVTATPAALATAVPAASTEMTATGATTSTGVTVNPAWTALTGTVPANVPRTITVVGEGRVSISPDTAQTTIGVEVLSNTVRAASSEVSTTMASVIAALKAQGIADKDMQTAGYNISVDRMFAPGQNQIPGQEQIRYRVSNNVSVLIHDTSKVGGVIDAAVTAGANNVYGVNFSVANPSKPADQASSKALDDARTRAAYLAGLAGLKLGPVISISEILGGGPILPYANKNAAIGVGGGGGGPISPGQEEVVRQIEVTFALQ